MLVVGSQYFLSTLMRQYTGSLGNLDFTVKGLLQLCGKDSLLELKNKAALTKTLYKLSQQVYGCGISQQVRRLRMELAREYILSTDMSLKEIVYRCGFRSFSYFSSVFKKYYGCSPGSFRKSANVPKDEEKPELPE